MRNLKTYNSYDIIEKYIRYPKYIMPRLVISNKYNKSPLKESPFYIFDYVREHEDLHKDSGPWCSCTERDTTT